MMPRPLHRTMYVVLRGQIVSSINLIYPWAIDPCACVAVGVDVAGPDVTDFRASRMQVVAERQMGQIDTPGVKRGRNALCACRHAEYPKQNDHQTDQIFFHDVVLDMAAPDHSNLDWTKSW